MVPRREVPSLFTRLEGADCPNRGPRSAPQSLALMPLPGGVPLAPELAQAPCAKPGLLLRGPASPCVGEAGSWVHVSALTVVEGAPRAKLGARRVSGALKSHFAGFGGMNFSSLVPRGAPAPLPQRTRPGSGSTAALWVPKPNSPPPPRKTQEQGCA